MKTKNIQAYKEQGVSMSELVEKHIKSQPQGHVTFDWSMQQCGNSIWYDMSGYFGEGETLTAVSIRYKWL